MFVQHKTSAVYPIKTAKVTAELTGGARQLFALSRLLKKSMPGAIPPTELVVGFIR